jgi:hypothetical protein
VNFLVLNVREYNFKDDDGKTVEGATVTYIDLTSVPEEGEKGQPVLQLSATRDQAHDFTTVPGMYEMSFTQRRGARGKATIAFARAQLSEPVTFA